MTVTSFIFLIIFFWLLLLSYLFFRLGSHYDKITRGVTKTNLRTILEEILEKEKDNEEKIKRLEKLCEEIEKDGEFHIQKLGVMRFNPFKDTGGEQSFILAILDKNKNGVVLSSLYSRLGNRWYVKQVKNGKGKDYPLSKEEERVVNEENKF